MTNTTSKKRKTDPMLLTCKDCGAEASIVGFEDVAELDELKLSWKHDHAECGRPNALKRIDEFNDRQMSDHYWWRMGDPPPEWMGTPPTWATDHHHPDTGFCPSKCFWTGEKIRLPLLHTYGRKIANGDMRVMDGIDVRLRQDFLVREPIVEILHGPKSDPARVYFELAEVRRLIDALELLIDIGENG